MSTKLEDLRVEKQRGWHHPASVSDLLDVYEDFAEAFADYLEVRFELLWCTSHDAPICTPSLSDKCYEWWVKELNEEETVLRAECVFTVRHMTPSDAERYGEPALRKP